MTASEVLAASSRRFQALEAAKKEEQARAWPLVWSRRAAAGPTRRPLSRCARVRLALVQVVAVAHDEPRDLAAVPARGWGAASAALQRCERRRLLAADASRRLRLRSGKSSSGRSPQYGLRGAAAGQSDPPLSTGARGTSPCRTGRAGTPRAAPRALRHSRGGRQVHPLAQPLAYLLAYFALGC